MDRLKFSIILLVLIFSTVSLSQDSFFPKWNFNHGGIYEITSNNKIYCDTKTIDEQGNVQIEKDTSNESIKAAIHVKQILDDGSFLLGMSILAFSKEQVSSDKTLNISGYWSQSGNPIVSVQVVGNNPVFQGSDFKNMLEQVSKNILHLTAQFKLSSTGVKSEIVIEGHPFRDLPDDTQLSRMIGKLVSKLIKKEDYTGSILADAFSVLPGHAVRLNEEWNIQKNYSIMGIDMVGAGFAKLISIHRIGNSNVALIEETMNYEVNTGDYCRRLSDFMKSVMAEAGMTIEMTANLYTKEAVQFRSITEFNLDSGCTINTEWKSLLLPLTGNMTMDVAGQNMKINMNVIVTGHSKINWEMKKN